MTLSFLFSSLVVAATPGIATVYVLNNSASLGRKQGIISALGIMTGGMIYNILAAVGLSSLIYLFPNLLSTIKVIGGLYLIYVGIMALKSKSKEENNLSYIKNSCYFKGILTNLANPKILLFFVTFIPQFIKNTENYGIEFILLGSVYLLVEIIWFICLATFISLFVKTTEGNFKKYMKYISAAVYLTMGLILITNI